MSILILQQKKIRNRRESKAIHRLILLPVTNVSRVEVKEELKQPMEDDSDILLRNNSRKESEITSQEVRNLLVVTLIAPSCSPWASSVFMAQIENAHLWPL